MSRRVATFSRSIVVALVLLLSLAVGPTGCQSWGRSDTAATIGISTDAACMAAALACEQWGGSLCTSLVAMGCKLGGGALGSYLNRWATTTASNMPAPSAIQATVAQAFLAEPVLVQYRAKVVAEGAQLKPVGVSTRPIGFTTPTPATSGTDTTPVQPHD